MGFWSDDSSQAQAYNDYQNSSDDHEAKISHELLAGAASYEAAKAYENHVDQNGQPQSHQEAKELMAGFAGAFVDREAETRGLDYIDRERAKRQASDDLSQQYDQNYGGGQGPQQNDQGFQQNDQNY